MPQRPDLRTIAADIRTSLADLPRERLVDILTYVFKEYVVEGPPPLRLDEQQPLAELADLSFAEVIQTLQARLEMPELTWFQVEGGRVSVRVSGVLTPLGGPDNASAASAQSAGTPVGSGAPGARFVEHVEVTAAPAGPTGGSQQRTGVRQSAPPPRRGVSISSRSGGGQGWPVRPNAEPPAPPTSPAENATAKAKEPERPADPSDDISSIRFSLLELD